MIKFYYIRLVSQLCPTLWTPWIIAHQALLSMRILQARVEYWSGLPCPPPGDIPNPRIKPRSPALQADSSQLNHQQGAQEFWSGEAIPSAGELPNPGIELGSPALQADSLAAELEGQLHFKVLVLGAPQAFLPSTPFLPPPSALSRPHLSACLHRRQGY